MQDPLDFSKQLIKGRIAETIFEQMFREVKKFTILSFGYEHIIPELARIHKDTHHDITLETLKRAPDFAIIDQTTKLVKLVEVKYSRQIKPDFLYQKVKKIHDCWNPCYLFLASLNGFFYDEVGEILKNEGRISPLSNEIIPETLQIPYLDLLRRFEKDN